MLLLDHPDFLTQQHGEKAPLVDALNELAIPELTLVSSWEWAVERKEQGCRLLGGWWTPEELAVLWASRPPLTRGVDAKELDLVKECCKLSGAPGILLHGLGDADYSRAYAGRG